MNYHPASQTQSFSTPTQQQSKLHSKSIDNSESAAKLKHTYNKAEAAVNCKHIVVVYKKMFERNHSNRTEKKHKKFFVAKSDGK